MCVRERETETVCVCVCVRKLEYIRSSLKKSKKAFDAIHTSLIVATHAIDFGSPKSYSEVDYFVLHLCCNKGSPSHV